MAERLFRRLGSPPVIIQSEQSECGLCCVVMVAASYGRRIDLNRFRIQQPVSRGGATVRQVMDIACRQDLVARAVRLEPEDLVRLKLPAILHWDMDHFVVLLRATKRSITILDPAVGRRRYRAGEVGRHLTGIAIELAPGQNFRRENTEQVTKLSDLFLKSIDFYSLAAQIFVLSLLLQLIALLMPFYVQLSIDYGLVRRDADLILLIALAFLFVVLIKTLLVYLRGQVLVYFSHQLGYQMAGNVFYHLLKLPVTFFERRHMGDIVSRFATLDNIRQLVTGEMITVVVDGLFSLITLVLLFIYSPLLTAFALVFLVAFGIVRAVMVPIERDRRQEVLVTDAARQSRFMENIRSITVTKTYGIELLRGRLWRDSYTEFVNASVNLNRLQVSATTVQTLLFGLDHVLTIYLGSRLVYSVELTVGQLVGFVFLKQHFVTSVSAMLPKLVELRMISLHLQRISDISCSETEFDSLLPPLGRALFRKRIEVENLCYRYPGSRGDVISKLSLTLQRGCCVAVCGGSGSGKSTLLKLLCGLVQPDAGAIRVDGIESTTLGLRSYRELFATVMHGDVLLAGTIGYNITLGTDREDRQRLERACAMAKILDDVLSLPMKFDTGVGEMGSGLSAGQEQRILLARAIYREADILVLDEAMSHLHQSLAETLLRSLKESGTTVVLVTHNPALLELADTRVAVDVSG
ncbi:MAG: peptidase domain-containing ABC transporter [Pseudohongiellaceae bacterium]